MDKEIIEKFKTIIGDKGYESEENHVIAKRYGLFTIIPARNEDVPIYRTKGENRKKMKKALVRRVQKKINSGDSPFSIKEEEQVIR